MKIIEPSAVLTNPSTDLEGVSALQVIEARARISHRAEDAQTNDTWRRFISSVVIDRGDWSVTEHETATVIFRVDRGITHELVRHRLFSFTQESTRFVRYGGKKVVELEFIRPSRLTAEATFTLACEQAEGSYNRLLSLGERPQEARSVLPNALAATIAVTGNFRNWRHFFLMRTSSETHPDFRRVTIPLLAVFQERIPLLYTDIEPNQRQIDNLRKPR